MNIHSYIDLFKYLVCIVNSLELISFKDDSAHSEISLNNIMIL